MNWLTLIESSIRPISRVYWLIILIVSSSPSSSASRANPVSPALSKPQLPNAADGRQKPDVESEPEKKEIPYTGAPAAAVSSVNNHVSKLVVHSVRDLLPSLSALPIGGVESTITIVVGGIGPNLCKSSHPITFSTEKTAVNFLVELPPDSARQTTLLRLQVLLSKPKCAES